jgi:MFS family permease
MDHAGAVVGPLVATLLLALGWQLRSVFWFSLVPGALALLTVITLREPALAPAPALSTEARAEPTPLPKSLRRYLAILAVFSLGNSSDAFLLLRARDLGVQIVSIPVLWAVLHVAKVVSSHLGGTWADRVERPRLIVSGWAIYALTYLGFGIAQHAWQAWVLFVVYGAYYGLSEPAEKALVRDLVPTTARGRAYGAYNFIIGVAALPAGVLTGWLWQTWSPQVALGSGAALAFASAAALLAWTRRPPEPRANVAV